MIRLIALCWVLLLGGFAVAQNIGPNPKAGVAPAIEYLGESSLSEYLAQSGSTLGASISSATTNITTLQNWLNSVHLRFINTDTSQSLQNLSRISCIKAVIPRQLISNIYISSPLIVPPGVCTEFYVPLSRVGSAGSITSNYSGDPASQALANIYQPAVIFVPGSQNTGSLTTVNNSVGSDRGSGVSIGRTWEVLSLSIANGGAGFSGGETCTTANGDAKFPYRGASFTVAGASGGAATSVAYSPTRWTTTNGVYQAPLLMLQNLWTAANGWTSSRAVFDGSGNFYTSCSGGTGLTVTATFFPDWCDGSNGCGTSTAYEGTYNNTGAAITSWFGRIFSTQSGDSTSATYGSTYGILMASYDYRFDEFFTQNSHFGMFFTGADIFGNRVNDVGSAVELKLLNGGEYHLPNVVLNNATSQYLQADGVNQVHMRGDLFMDTSHAPSTSTASILLGSNVNATAKNNNLLDIELTLENAGVAGGVPAVSCAYTQNSTIDLKIANLQAGGTPYQGQNSSYAAFGTGCDASNRFSGSIDNVGGSLFSGSIPNAAFDIWQAATNQWINSLSLAFPDAPKGRLSLSSVNAVMTADGFSIGTIYYLPYVGRSLPIFNGSYWQKFDIGANGLTLVLDATHQPNSQTFDIYAVNIAGTPTLCAQYWGAAAARSTSVGGFSGSANSSLSQVNGIWVNGAAIASGNCYGNNASYALSQNQGTYLGSFYTNSAGTTQVNCDASNSGGGGGAGVFLWNAYNRISQVCYNSDTGTWATSASGTWAILGASDTIYWLDGLKQSPVSYTAFVVAGNNTQGACGYFGVTFNSQSSAPSQFGQSCAATATLAQNYQTISTSGSIWPATLGLQSANAMKASPSGTTTYMPVTKQENLSLTVQW